MIKGKEMMIKSSLEACTSVIFATSAFISSPSSTISITPPGIAAKYAVFLSKPKSL